MLRFKPALEAEYREHLDRRNLLPLLIGLFVALAVTLSYIVYAGFIRQAFDPSAFNLGAVPRLDAFVVQVNVGACILFLLVMAYSVHALRHASSHHPHIELVSTLFGVTVALGIPLTYRWYLGRILGLVDSTYLDAAAEYDYTHRSAAACLPAHGGLLDDLVLLAPQGACVCRLGDVSRGECQHGPGRPLPGLRHGELAGLGVHVHDVRDARLVRLRWSILW